MTHAFDAEIHASDSGGAYVVVPFDVRAAFGTARPKVVATFDGHPYRGLISPMGGRAILIVRKDVRAAIGKQPGDAVRVTVEADTAPREVDVPDDLAAALDAAGVRAAFDRLAYTHRKEYAEWIAEARKPETRARRIAQAAAMVGEGRTRS